MKKNELKDILETLFFITDVPVSLERLKSVFSDKPDIKEELLKEAIEEITQDYAQRPIELRFVADGYQFATRPHNSHYVRRLFREKTTIRISNSALETLSIIAYKQPVTRAEIEDVRGVEVTNVIDTLLERKLIRIVGRKETVGRPLLYGTTLEFMRYFGLKTLNDLPIIEDMSTEKPLEPSGNPEAQQAEAQAENELNSEELFKEPGARDEQENKQEEN
ncbi:MAG: SMC-Scp complex subunit ScpB [Elusimicrobia bacterium RIFOXYA2_FULL_39_19]|nr:MAG: SMC-Scp complex subunit ScpB [Elusimicrobia bacterium RIFOXYA2_FULL_39_19]